MLNFSLRLALCTALVTQPALSAPLPESWYQMQQTAAAQATTPTPHGPRERRGTPQQVFNLTQVDSSNGIVLAGQKNHPLSQLPPIFCNIFNQTEEALIFAPATGADGSTGPLGYMVSGGSTLSLVGSDPLWYENPALYNITQTLTLDPSGVVVVTPFACIKKALFVDPYSHQIAPDFFAVIESTSRPSSLIVAADTPAIAAKAGQWNGFPIFQGLGDVNGDGLLDFLVSYFHYQFTTTAKAFIVFGQLEGWKSLNLLDMNASQGISITDTRIGSFGYNGADVGDIDGDGFADTLLTNAVSYTGPSYSSSVIIFGQASLSNIYLNSPQGVRTLSLPLATQIPNVSGNNGPNAIFCDVTGSGRSSVILTSTYWDSVANKAYIVYGGSNFTWPSNLDTMTATTGITISDFPQGEQNGYLVNLKCKDVNHDGIDDAVFLNHGNIGYPNINENYATDIDTPYVSYVIFGQKGPYAGSFSVADLNATTGLLFSTHYSNLNMDVSKTFNGGAIAFTDNGASYNASQGSPGRIVITSYEAMAGIAPFALPTTTTSTSTSTSTTVASTSTTSSTSTSSPTTSTASTTTTEAPSTASSSSASATVSTSTSPSTTWTTTSMTSSSSSTATGMAATASAATSTPVSTTGSSTSTAGTSKTVSSTSTSGATEAAVASTASTGATTVPTTVTSPSTSGKQATTQVVEPTGSSSASSTGLIAGVVAAAGVVVVAAAAYLTWYYARRLRTNREVHNGAVVAVTTRLQESASHGASERPQPAYKNLQQALESVVDAQAYERPQPAYDTVVPQSGLVYQVPDADSSFGFGEEPTQMTGYLEPVKQVVNGAYEAVMNTVGGWSSTDYAVGGSDTSSQSVRSVPGSSGGEWNPSDYATGGQQVYETIE